MKLIYVIVRNTDGSSVIAALNMKGYSVTKLSSTGGFLRKGNTTLIIGTEEKNVDHVIDIVKKICGPRQRVVANTTVLDGMSQGGLGAVSVDVGGATIFVMDVERFDKI